MKAVVYSTHSFEKELLAKANHKKHDITLISNSLNLDTATFAKGKDAIVVSTNDDVSASVIEKLKSYGIKYIATLDVFGRSVRIGYNVTNPAINFGSTS